MPRLSRSWVALGLAVPVVVGLGAFAINSGIRADGAQDATLTKRLTGAAAAAAATAPPAPTLKGLDLTKITLGDAATTPLPDGKTARLTIDPVLQKTASAIMSMHHVPEAAIVLMDVQTGKILVYASHIEKGPLRDLAVEATAPAASVFKVVTGTALVESAGLSPETKECYSGGEQRLNERDLVPDPKRDKWCSTLAGAMGRSINTIFARSALRHLKPHTLEEHAKALGFGGPFPFDVPVQQSALKFPEDQLGYARTAAGFWNTTLSPIHAAWLSATVARSGEPVRPVLVNDVVDEKGKALWVAPSGLGQKRAMKIETAQQVTTMMDATVTDGTSYKAFHDKHGQSFLPGIAVAGKTGTLTDAQQGRFYTWFTGFAPSHPYVVQVKADADEKPSPPRQVAIGVLVVNNPTWSIKANLLAREVMRAYFAQQKVPGVTMPATGEKQTSPDDDEESDKSKKPERAHDAERGSKRKARR